jgi:hypothetical protein
MEPPPLPRPPGDEENLQRLRQEAAERMRREPYTVYGAPPAPVYGGPPGPTRRWTLRGILLVILSALAAIAAAIWGYEKVTTPVYGGPPAPVYGGPPVEPPEPKK